MKTRALSLSILTAAILFSESSTAQFWAERSDEINIGLMISHLRQVTHTNKPGNIGWIHAWPMTVVPAPITHLIPLAVKISLDKCRLRVVALTHVAGNDKGNWSLKQ